MTMKTDVQRLDNLFKGVAENINRTAEIYVKARDKHGQQFEDELVDLGYERAWLRSVYDLGQGHLYPKVIFLSPDKREVMRLVSIRDQKKALEKGINGHSVDDLSIDELRQALLKGKNRVKRTSKKMKAKPPNKRWVANADGVRHLVQNLSWEEELAIIEHAIAMGWLTLARMKKLAKVIRDKLKT